MRTCSAALKAHFASGKLTVTRCLKATLKNGTLYGFTEHTSDIFIASDSLTYFARNGFFSKATQTSSAMNVDTTGISGPQISPNIVEHDIFAGKWDDARFALFLVNYNDLTMGRMYLRGGWIGEVRLGLNSFEYDIRGIMQAYTKTIVESTSPGCRANLGDARCRAALGTFTVTGTVGSVNSDNLTIYDPGRTEAGPTGGVAIVSITNAAPNGVVTLADASLNLVDGQAITIAGVVGMTPVNVVTYAKSPSGNTFLLPIDTSDTAFYPPYVSGGTVTPFSGTGGTTGYFDGGKIHFITGQNAGLEQEVKAYVPGQVSLLLPMPFPVAPGDTYSLQTGCDKTVQMCRDRYNNIANMVAEPYLRGLDKLVQVGRHA